MGSVKAGAGGAKGEEGVGHRICQACGRVPSQSAVGSRCTPGTTQGRACKCSGVAACGRARSGVIR